MVAQAVRPGEDGAPGVGVPAGGDEGDVLAKATGANFDTEWVEPTGGGASTLVGLTDVTGAPGNGKAPVSDGAGAFPLTDVATQAELNAEASTRGAADTAEAAARASGDASSAASLAAHLSDASDAHDASAISFVPGGSLAATDVQAAILEAASESGLTFAQVLAALAAIHHTIDPVTGALRIDIPALQWNLQTNHVRLGEGPRVIGQDLTARLGLNGLQADSAIPGGPGFAIVATDPISQTTQYQFGSDKSIGDVDNTVAGNYIASSDWADASTVLVVQQGVKPSFLAWEIALGAGSDRLVVFAPVAQSEGWRELFVAVGGADFTESDDGIVGGFHQFTFGVPAGKTLSELATWLWGTSGFGYGVRAEIDDDPVLDSLLPFGSSDVAAIDSLVDPNPVLQQWFSRAKVRLAEIGAAGGLGVFGEPAPASQPAVPTTLNELVDVFSATGGGNGLTA